VQPTVVRRCSLVWCAGAAWGKGQVAGLGVECRGRLARALLPRRKARQRPLPHPILITPSRHHAHHHAHHHPTAPAPPPGSSTAPRCPPRAWWATCG
jgi:hypothetical protein